MSLQVHITRKAFRHGNLESLVVEGLTFEVREAEIIVLFGPSGCGKSTVLRIVAGLDSNYQGSVLLDGRPIHAPTRKIGMTVQSQVSFDWLSVGQNIAFGFRYGSPAGRLPSGDLALEVHRLASLVGLRAEDLKKYPSQISGGMKQRMAFARALAAQPSVMLLDEPFSSLDYQSREGLQEVVVRARRRFGTAFLCVTHDPDEAVFLGDRILRLSSSPARIVEEIGRTEIDKSDEYRYSAAFQRLKRDLRERTKPITPIPEEPPQ